MTLPQAPDLGATSEPSGEPPAVSHFGQPVSVAPVSVAPVAVTAVSGAPVPGGLETLRHRPDFLKAAAARRQGTASFLLQARARDDGQASARIGFTASKKIGNAVARNRAKRRMRAAAHDVLKHLARPGWDYVLVARPQATIARPFAGLLADLHSAVQSVHRDRK